ncbi:sensor histidine kinase [Pseudobdellovibrio sp. HCB154]|uniref:sensor histidine kinase n=1 Tax=Pseudobdellovibrio sp. HCB154 TaxID=3386277 RepID=UPI003917442C
MKLPVVRSIVFYVSTLLVVTVTLALGVFGFLNYTEIKNSRINNLKANLSIQTSQLSIALALPGWNLDNFGVERIIDSFLLDRNISAVIVDVGDKEKSIRIRDSNWQIVTNDTIPILSEDFKEEKKIVFKNETIGSVQVYVTPKFIQQEFMETVTRIVFFTLALDLVLVLLLYFLLSRNVLKPITEIERYAVAVRSGGEAPNLQMDGYFLTEFQSLTVSIEDMVTQLVKAKSDAETTGNIKSQFLDIAAHELKTPVTALTLLVDMANVYVSKGVPLGKSELERIKKQTNRLKTLLEDLLDVSRMERGFLLIKPVHTDIVALVSESVDDYKNQVPSRTFSFTKSNSKIILNCDPEKINQVLGNLLNNAIHYSPEGSPIEISITATPTVVRISIKDYGPGISKNLQTKLFTKFFRVTSNESAIYPGLGLGLYISRTIIEKHGGTIGLTSEEGHGSTFYFDLPRNS